MAEKQVYISYDRNSGELLINWDHERWGYYDPLEQDDGPAWVSLKRDSETDEVIGVMVENFESLCESPLVGSGVRDFTFTTNATVELDIDEE
jgi:hypothetical protein